MPSTPSLPAPAPLRRLWRGIKIGAATIFVLWNLFFLIVRNPLDLWWEDHLEKWSAGQSWWPAVEKPFETVDRATYYYGNFFGVDQGWSMFTPEMARRSPFLATSLEFTDGSSLLLLSENEPADFNHYVRVGGWRRRKLEDKLVKWSWRDELPNDDEQLLLYEAYARWGIRRWREQSLEDHRLVERVVLLDRRFRFPKPNTDPNRFDAPEVSIIGAFGPDGRFLFKEETK